MHRRQSRRVITYVTVLRVHVLMKRHDGSLRSPLVAIADVATIATPTHEFSIQMHELNSFPVRAILLRSLHVLLVNRAMTSSYMLPGHIISVIVNLHYIQ